MAFVRNPVKPDGKPLLSPGQWRTWAVSLLQPAVVGRWVVVVNLVLLALIAYSLAKLTWMLLPAPREEAPAPPVIAPAGAVSAVASRVPSPREMAQWHLFGEAQVINVGAAANAAPQTSLALSLRGVIASRGKTTARAIIADSAGNEQFYAIDAPLPGGAILKEIRADRVILLRDGRYETLLLPKDGMAGEGMPGSAPPPLDAAMMQEFSDTLASNPQSLMERVHPVPVNEGGKFVGYRLLPGQDPAFLARFGMEPNDIVTAVNGMSLDNPAKGMQLLNSLKTEGEVRVETLRNGAPRSFILRMNQ
ncbi:MAG: type II secretion system protein GspC [Pseudomonadota bacterium]